MWWNVYLHWTGDIIWLFYKWDLMLRILCRNKKERHKNVALLQIVFSASLLCLLRYCRICEQQSLHSSGMSSFDSCGLFLHLDWNELLNMRPAPESQGQFCSGDVHHWLDEWSARASRGLLEALQYYRTFLHCASDPFVISWGWVLLKQFRFWPRFVIIHLWHRTNCGFLLGPLA